MCVWGGQRWDLNLIAFSNSPIHLLPFKVKVPNYLSVLKSTLFGAGSSEVGGAGRVVTIRNFHSTL